jgi:hypothetical protein
MTISGFGLDKDIRMRDFTKLLEEAGLMAKVLDSPIERPCVVTYNSGIYE